MGLKQRADKITDDEPTLLVFEEKKLIDRGCPSLARKFRPDRCISAEPSAESVQGGMYYENHGNTQHDQHDLLHRGAELGAFVQAGNQVGHGDVDKARRGNGQHIRHQMVGERQREIGRDTADDRGQPGQGVIQQGS